MSDKELGMATVTTSDDAWVKVKNTTVAFFSKYEDYAFTNARDLARDLNGNPEMKLKFYNEAIQKEKQNND